MEIGYRRRLDDDPGRGQMLHHLVAHFGRGAHAQQFNAARRRKMYRAGNQNHAGAAGGRGFGERVAHLAAGAIGDVAHRIERLLGGAGRNQHGLALQVAALVGGAFDRSGDGFGVSQTSGAGHPAGEVSAARLDDGMAALDQGCQVGLGGGMLQHVDVHGRGDNHRAGEGEIESGEKIVRQAVCQFGHQVRRSRRDDKQFVLLRDRDVLDGAFDGEEVGEDFAAGKGSKGERADKLLRRPGHHNLNLVALLHQQARQFRRFVSCDAAADREEAPHRVLENSFRHRIVVAVGQRSGEIVLHQAAAHFLHGDDSGFLGRRRQHRTCAALQLPRALGGDDDEAVRALLRIIGQGTVSVITRGFSFSHTSLP